MKKRFLSLLLAIVLLMTLTPIMMQDASGVLCGFLCRLRGIFP